MEVRIRNVDPAIVSIIDEYAKENNETRSEYLRRLLQYEAHRKLLEQSHRLNEDKIKPIYLALEIMMNNIKELSFELQKLMALIIYLADMDQNEVDYLLDSVVHDLEE